MNPASAAGAGLPVLWLYGPPGVGKTTTAWEFFIRLTRRNIPAGYVDIDQLGICYATPTARDLAPEPPSDPGRHRVKTRNLDAVAANLTAAGARCLVVSGVVDAVGGVDTGLLPHAALTLCRLRCAPAELRRRLARRGRPGDQLTTELRYAEALDRNGLPGVCVDTTDRDVATAVRLVREQTGGWPGPDPGPPPAVGAGASRSNGPSRSDEPSGPESVAVPDPGEVLWLCGVTAVGKSTLGWEVYQQVSRAGVRTAFVDLDQIGFHRPMPAQDPGNHRLKAANLAAVWRNYRAGGARRLVVVGPVDGPGTVPTYLDALPAGTVTLCRLHAGRDRLVERVMLRGRGLGTTWGLPGDELVGRSAEALRRVAERAAAEAETLERAGVGDLRIDVDGRPARVLADEILRRAGWPVGPVGGQPGASVDGRPAKSR